MLQLNKWLNPWFFLGNNGFEWSNFPFQASDLSNNGDIDIDFYVYILYIYIFMYIYICIYIYIHIHIHIYTHPISSLFVFLHFTRLGVPLPGENLTQELRNIAKATPPNRTACDLRCRTAGSPAGAKQQKFRCLTFDLLIWNLDLIWFNHETLGFKMILASNIGNYMDSSMKNGDCTLNDWVFTIRNCGLTSQEIGC